MLEPRRFILAVVGPRQVGKTTLAHHAARESGLPSRYATADEPTLRGEGWIQQQWELARLLARDTDGPALLILDEIQKLSGWSETVKRLWDEDSLQGRDIRVVVLGSAPLLVQRGLSESLAGRFEVLHAPHWSFSEMRDAFDWDLDRYIYFGGYPGAATLSKEPDRWAAYVRDALIETTISRDVLLLTRVDKPALLRRLFELACQYSSQIVSYTKLLGQLEDAGNTVTLAHYLDLLHSAGMVSGLTQFAGDAARQRGSSPKLQVLNTALMSALAARSPELARADHSYWGRLVESAIGAHIINSAGPPNLSVHYWRDRGREVDFVLRHGHRVIGLEVKSGRAGSALPGMEAFRRAFAPDHCLLIGGEGIAIEEFLSSPVERWL